MKHIKPEPKPQQTMQDIYNIKWTPKQLKRFKLLMRWNMFKIKVSVFLYKYFKINIQL